MLLVACYMVCFSDSYSDVCASRVTFCLLLRHLAVVQAYWHPLFHLESPVVRAGSDHAFAASLHSWAA